MPGFFIGKFGQHQRHARIAVVSTGSPPARPAALLDAAKVDGDVLACYVLDPRLKNSSGPRRLAYLYDALRELQGQTRRQAAGDPRSAGEANPTIAKAIGASQVHISGDYSPFGAAATTRSARRSATPAAGDRVAILVSPGRVTKDDGTPYKVFTPYYNAWRQHGWRAPAKSGRENGKLDRPRRGDRRSGHPRRGRAA